MGKIIQKEIKVTTTGRGLHEISDVVDKLISKEKVDIGLCHVFIHHTSASLIISENADPTVQQDLERFMAKLIPDGSKWFSHTLEGPDDMPSHIRSVLTQNNLTIPIKNNRLSLGTWQGIFVWEHRISGKDRIVTVSIDK